MPVLDTSRTGSKRIQDGVTVLPEQLDMLTVEGIASRCGIFLNALVSSSQVTQGLFVAFGPPPPFLPVPRQNHLVNPGERSGEGARAVKSLPSQSWWICDRLHRHSYWDGGGWSGTTRQSISCSTTRSQTCPFALPEPRHGDPSSRRRICARSMVARRSLEQKIRS